MEGTGIELRSKRISSSVRLPAVPVVDPIWTESVWLVSVCVVLDANGDPKAALPVAMNPSRTALLPVPFF
jgi:hypothetical protein